MSNVTKEVRLEDELKNSYLTYAMSVIVSRALPDIRDGLKPSQRRILIAMNDLKLGPKSKFRKCAKIAGDTSGNYHPHGEAVIYPTLVRMAQNFNMRYPLVDSQGNFGSLDGDPPAAMRYTEARMTALATEMMEDLEKDTVDFESNYDETRQEPTVLPSKFPNLLVNGSVGIAVGMSTSIPPNNLSEICDGIVQVIDNPNITVEELCEIIKGPDFPTGAIICGRNQIKSAYTTGRGIITVRSNHSIEEGKNNKSSIIFHEIPYQLNKAKIIEKIADLVKEGKITGIADVRDESGRKDPVRIVVELKKGENEEVIVNQLYKYTSLQTTCSIIMLALIDGRPKMVNIKEMITHFVLHRQVIIRRRTIFLLEKAKKRHHIVEGLLIALTNIDKIIKVIRASENANEAKAALMKEWSFSIVQADAIIQMRLGTLTGLEFNKLDEEKKSLEASIAEFEGILGDENKILAIIKEETKQIRDKYGDERRTKIGTAIGDFAIEDIIPDDQWIVVITHHGYIKRMALELYRKQNRGGSGVIGADMKEGDFIEHFFNASAHQYILFFTNFGKVYWLKVYDVPELTRISKGRNIVNLLNLDEQEMITSMISVKHFDDRWLMMATEQGVIKKIALSAFSRPNRGGIRAINLDEGDSLISTVLTEGKQDIILGTKLGRACRFNESEVRPLGRATRGVRGCKLQEGDTVVGMVAVREDHSLLTLCSKGYGKRSPYEAYRSTRRGVQGVLNIKKSEKTGDVVAIVSVRDEDQLMIITYQGMVIRMGISLRLLSRASQGVRLIRLKEQDTVVNVTKLTKEVLEQEDSEQIENSAEIQDLDEAEMDAETEIEDSVDEEMQESDDM